jgi:hypothetical protein
MYQMAVLYSKWPKNKPTIFHYKALEYLVKFGFFGLKRNHPATLVGCVIMTPMYTYVPMYTCSYKIDPGETHFYYYYELTC